MDKKVLLMILDGWGIGDHTKSDVIYTMHPKYITALTEKYPHAQLRTDGENVGLPNGQMGNSEVGHMNIGAGRVVYQDLVKINRACADNSILQNPEIVKAFEYAKKNGVNVHFMGLTSDGGVHSSIDHLYKLCEISKHYGIKNTYIHCFMDGRDTDPKSGKGFIADLEKHLAATTGQIASIIGRYYAMDRDKRWERVKIAYDMLVNGVGAAATDMVEAMQRSYDEGVTDEFVKPIVRVDETGKAVGCIKPNDMVIFFNYRNDRAKEITIALTQEDMPEQGMHTLPLYYCCMTPYDAKFQGLHILFDKENVKNTIGEYVSSLGLSQLRIAETEKYAHVTFFLNGGREDKFPGEYRILVASPKVATYDLKPEMSAHEEYVLYQRLLLSYVPRNVRFQATRWRMPFLLSTVRYAYSLLPAYLLHRMLSGYQRSSQSHGSLMDLRMGNVILQHMLRSHGLRHPFLYVPLMSVALSLQVMNLRSLHLV